MRRVNWTITEQQHQELKRLSKETGLPISELVRRALDSYFGSLLTQQDQSSVSPEIEVTRSEHESEVIP